MRIEDRHSNEPYLSRLARDHEIEVNLVYGGIHELRSQLFGNLTLELLGSDTQIEAAIADLRAVTSIADLGSGDKPDLSEAMIVEDAHPHAESTEE